jgi:hypothetical protein
VAAEFSFIAELPAGYDSRTRLALRDDNQVIATHPEHPPLLLQPTGQWLDLKAPPVHSALRSSTC